MKHFAMSLFTLLLFSSFCIISVGLGHAAGDSWVQKAPMPTARSSLGAAVVNGRIYAIGGYSTNYLSTNEEYDPATNTWTTKQPMPTPRSNFGIAVYQNKIFVIGGASGNSQIEVITDTNEMYDPATDTWTQKTKMPLAGEQLQANVLNDKIYLTGGLVSNDTQLYDPATDTWASAPPIPNQVYFYASAVANNKIYVLGGSGVTSPNLNQIYNPQTSTWSNGQTIPSPISSEAAAATTGEYAPKRIYVIGGRINYSQTASNINQVYDPTTDQWTIGSEMPTARFNLAIAVVNDTLYALGGVSNTSHSAIPYANNEQYTPPSPISSQEFGGTQLGYIITAIVVGILLIVVILILAKKRSQKLKDVAAK
jgi:N-acetylneuraminic acid mutarotase